ncbi:MAG: HAMP domain-containing histidine kinase [Deltaproteobacteria bacterium]|nr:HAMP domain-containing histidine kinase [Deltaproteobacteria bacterium]
MPPSRATTPLAGWSVVATFVLIGIALLATVWSTRSSVINASDAVRRGQALAMEQAVRADLADLEAVPSTEDLQRILRDHFDEGLRYLGMVEGRGRIVASAGDAIGDSVEEPVMPSRQMQEVGGRVRVTLRALRRMKAGGRAARYIVEIEPVQADALRSSAQWSLTVGAIAAASLLGVAIVLVRREARRNADERARERERRLAHLGEMSAVLAHEIKNPLASLKGNAQLLAQMLAKTMPEGEKPRTKAERVVEEAVRLEQLTNGLLNFVRTGAIHRVPVDPGAIVREAAASVPGDVTVETSAAPASWSLDAGRIREVVINLVDNAVAAGAPVNVALRSDGKNLVVEVADHGPGVPEEDRERIFEPFHTGKTQGTGLGLAVARRVVESHGGTLMVLSAPSGGALFRAEIPES